MFIIDMDAWKKRLKAAGLETGFYQQPLSIELSVSTDRDGDDSFEEIARFVDRVREICKTVGIDANSLRTRRNDDSSDHEVVTRYVSFLPEVAVGKRSFHMLQGIVMVDEIDGLICHISNPGSGEKLKPCEYHDLEGREF